MAPKRYYEAPEYGCGIELGAALLFLSYEGASAVADTVEPAEFWFADLVRAGGLTYDPDPAFIATHGYAKEALYHSARPDWTVSTGTWLKRLAADLGLLFLPVDTLLATGLIGQAALQVIRLEREVEALHCHNANLRECLFRNGLERSGRVETEPATTERLTLCS